jgi:hypothetical protein
MRVRRPLACLAASAALLAAAVPSAGAATETATSGAVTAQMSYKELDFGFKNVRISITRNGVVLLDRKPGASCEFCLVWPGGGFAGDSVRALPLDADPEPEVIFDLFTGGAHCCLYSLIYRFDPATNSYTALRHDWFNAAYVLFDPEADGIPEFRTRDDRFAYKYASYAGSQYPVQVWRYAGGQMLDVTTSYPSLVRKNIKFQRRDFNRRKGRSDVRAPLAALAADYCLLGNCAKGFAIVREARRDGYLKKRLVEFKPAGAKFVRNLRGFLKRLGYR